MVNPSSNTIYNIHSPNNCTYIFIVFLSITPKSVKNPNRLAQVFEKKISRFRFLTLFGVLGKKNTIL